MIYTILLVLAFLCLMLGKIYLSRHMQMLHQPTDEEMIYALTVEHGLSAYDIFQISGKQWTYSNSRIENDFSQYLKSCDIPPYVRQYLRSQPFSTKNLCQDHPPLHLGSL